jgi:hypothetical protein
MKAKNNKEWHRLVCERDGYICYICGKCFDYANYFNDQGLNQYVCGDHIKTKGAHPELKLEVENGRCACFQCHELRHRGLT